jgi:putative transposase
MSTTSRPQQRYDHRLRDLVQRPGDLTIATDAGVPRSTARGWLRAAPTVVVSLEVADLTDVELRQQILELRRRIEKLAALLRLALALLQPPGSGCQESVCPTDKPSCRSCAPSIGRASIPLRAVLRFLRVSRK